MYSLLSQNTEQTIAEFSVCDKRAIRNAIVAHLTANSTDVLEYRKDFNEEEKSRYAGSSKIIDFYQVNPKNGKISRVIVRGEREFFQSIEDDMPAISS